MDIRALSHPGPAVASATRPASAGPPPASDPAASMPQDTLHLQSAAPRSTSVVQSVFDHQDLNKGDHSYEVRGFGFSPDGTSLVVYQDPRDPAGNYVSARSSDGQLLWERRVSDEKVASIAVSPDGTVLARTEKRLCAVGPGGRESFVYEYPPGAIASEPVYAADGTAWWVDKRQGKLCGVRPDGTPATPASGLESVMDKCDELVSAGKGDPRLLARCGNDVWRVDAGTGTSENLLSFKKPALPSDPSWRNLVDGSNYSARIADVRPTPDGGFAATVVESISVFGSPHCGPKFFDETYDMPRTTLTQKRLLLVGPDGTSFTTPEMGNAAVSLESSKSVLLGRNSGSNSTVERATPEGVKELATVSHIAYSVLPRPTGGTLLVHHAGTVDELGADGKPVHSVSPGPDLAMFRVAGLAPDGRVILANDRKVSLVDMESGKIDYLTDHSVDASTRLAAEAIMAEGDGSDGQVPGKVEVADDFVLVNGVKVPRRQGPGEE